MLDSLWQLENKSPRFYFEHKRFPACAEMLWVGSAQQTANTAVLEIG